MSDHSKLKLLAEAATPQDFDSAEEKSEGGHIECPHCNGQGEVELEADYLNYDSAALGVQFYGIGNEFGAAEAYYRAANPAAVLNIIAELERATRRLCACGDCGGRGEVYSGHSTSQGYNQPPEPDMDVCGTCGGDGVLGPIEDFEALAAERDQLKTEVERQAAEIRELKDAIGGLKWVVGEMKGQHKNLHRSLCARFGYVHDEKDWWRDDVSLEEHIAAQIGQLKAEVEALRREIASIKPSPISTDKTTIGYTGCVICGQYADHGGLQCPKLAARSLAMENQRVAPVEPIRVDHPLDAAMSKGEKP